MDFFKEEITTKKTVGRELIETLISVICFTIIIYICLSSFNENLIPILQAIKDGKITAFTIIRLLFPVIFIVAFALKLAIITFKLKKKK